MIAAIWHDYLYQPLFNLLIWLYNTWTDQNMGWAVVYLTILLRIVLLPFTVVSEKQQRKNEALYAEVARLEKEYQKDPVIKKQEIRRILRQRRVYPWAKFVVLGMQVLVFILLYQVFLRGITGEKIARLLYPTVDFPGRINTIFLGFDLGERHNVLWAAIVGVWLALEIYFEMRKKPANSSDLLYFIAFPVFIAAALWWLPMVKSLFVLASLVFSLIFALFAKLFFKPIVKVASEH